MTTWLRNEPDATRRQCVLDIASLADGSPAPLATSFAGKIFIRLGGVSWTAASGTLTNTGYDGHWVYQGTQAESNNDSNEIELRIVDTTYFAQTFVELTDVTASTVATTLLDTLLSGHTTAGSVGQALAATPSVSSIVNAVLDELLSGHAIIGSVGDGIAIAAGLLQGNFFMDQTNNSDPNGQTSARLRIFRNSVDASSATDGGSGQGEFASFTVTTTYAGPSKIATHRVVRA